MPDIFDYDPVTGITDYFDYNEAEGVVTIHSKQDVEPLLRLTAEERATRATDHGIKSGFWHYARVPTEVLHAMKLRGIDPFDPNNTKRFLDEINTNFPNLRTTDKRHALKS